jgi:hypothetical protein
MTAPPLLLTLSLLTTPDAETRALAYLTREVPRWSAENKCYSCHHNGDAARALYDAVRRGRSIEPKALADTTRWLSRPGEWDKNGGDGPFNDRKRARLQFAAALAGAVEADQIKDRDPLRKASRALVEQQDADGSWPIGDDTLVGSPATHGTALATTLARRTLVTGDRKLFRAAIERTDVWLRKVEVKTVLDAAAVLSGLEKADDRAAVAQRRRCLELIRKGEARDGGWGPYTNSASEVFDTAIVLLALTTQSPTDDSTAMLRRGRAWLVAEQADDGSWRETTRPSGAESYPQRLSTTGWATLALLATH